MFWIQTVTFNDYYCICHGAWQNFKIARIEALLPLVTLTFIQESGKNHTLMEARPHEFHPIYGIEFNFAPGQHVKIVVEGGTVVFAGQSYASAKRTNKTSAHLGTCPFGDEGSWRSREKRSAEKLIDNVQEKEEEEAGNNNDDVDNDDVINENLTTSDQINEAKNHDDDIKETQ